MTASDLHEHFVSHPTVQILRLHNAKWILPFLYSVFKERERFTIDERQLVHLLSEALTDRTEEFEDVEEAGIAFGETEEMRSRKYVTDWVKRRILQDLSDAQGTVQYQLSAHTERLFQWLSSLQDRKHVGTESRFRLLFDTLRDMVEHTEDNVQTRLDILKDKKAEIEKEIRALELGQSPDSYSNEQVKERVDLFTRLCYELVGDFREVEDNFRLIHRNIVTQHTRDEQHKGAIVGYAFEAYNQLRESSQGRSFYAFWEFLISRAGQEEWSEMTGKLLTQIADREIDADQHFLRNIKTLLLKQGRTVYEANDRMAEKLSRIITEKEVERQRRLRRQLSGVKELILNLLDRDEQPEIGIEVEEGPDLRLIIDRRLQLEARKPLATIEQPGIASESIADPLRFSRLLNHPSLDRKKLWRKVELTLDTLKVATLSQVLQMNPLEFGLAEVVGYYHFVREYPTKCSVIYSDTETIPLNQEQTKFVELPCLMFNI